MPSVTVISLAIVGVGLVLLGFMLFRLVREVRRAKVLIAQYTAAMGDSAGLIRARSAALSVAVAQRRRSAEPDRILFDESDRTGGRP